MPTSSAQEYTNAWNGWEVQVLHDLGAPPSQANIGFLDQWHSYEESYAVYNPLNLTGPPGVKSINSQGVQSYASATLGAQYTAANIRAYPSIYKMLKSDSVNSTIINNPSGAASIIAELQHWGSKTFASAVATASKSGFIPGPGQSTTGAIGHAIAAPFEDAGSLFKWIGGNWERILWVAGGSVLIILGLIFVIKSQSKGNTFTFSRGE